MENLQIFEQANPSFAEMFAAMRGNEAAATFNAAVQAQWQSHPAPTHTGKPRPADVVDLSNFRVFHAADAAMTAWIHATAKDIPAFFGCKTDYTAQTVTAIFTGNDATAVKSAQKTLLWATGMPDGFAPKNMMKQLTAPASVCGVKNELFTAHAVFAYTPATAENTTMRTQKQFSSDGFGSPKRRDYRSRPTVAAPQEPRHAKATVKTGRPAKDRYLGQVDGDFLYRMELAKYARTQASLYMQGDRLPALHEVLWAVATRFFPQPVISYMNREITCQGAQPVAYVKRDAQATLQALLPCFLAEWKGNTLKLTFPPQGDADTPPDVNLLDSLLNAADLLDVVINRTLCQADEALTAVDMMDGADLADILIETTPCLANEAWEDYATRLLTHAPAMTGRLREVVTEKLMTIPAVKASVAPDNMEA